MFCTELIEINERESYRKFDEHRNIKITLYHNFVEAKTENSSIIALYYKTSMVPYIDKPNEGIFQINIAHTKNDILLNFLNCVYSKNKSIDLKELVIKSGLEVFGIFIDIKIIEKDTNLFGLCLEAINAIIKKLKLKCVFEPCFFSYASINGNIISDPDEKELENSQWRYQLVMKSSREVIWSEKTGESCDENDIFNLLVKAYSDYCLKIDKDK